MMIIIVNPETSTIDGTNEKWEQNQRTSALKIELEGDQRADNQQQQNELKTITSQHRTLQKKTALHPRVQRRCFTQP
jgi:hypothetical protein